MRLLILGTGGMARSHVANFSEIDGVDVVGGVDVDMKTAQAFCDKHNAGRAFDSLESALEWGEFDAVANVTPDSIHYATTLKCLDAGKHVFCEKPLATDYEKAREMTQKAQAKNRVAMVNLTYRNVAQLHKARELVLAGEIGDVKHVEASYLQSWLVQPLWGHWDKEDQWLWRLSTEHGSNGALGDIGIHILDFASFGSASNFTDVFCRLHTFDKAPNNQIGAYKLDANDSFSMSVSFENGAIGVVHASRFATGHINELKLRIYGDKGGLEVVHNWKKSFLRVCLGEEDMLSGTWREIEVNPVITNYQRFTNAVKVGKTAEPSFSHAANLQKVLDLSTVSNTERSDQTI